MAEVSSPGQELQPAHHGGTSLAQRQEDYDELKAPTTLGRCLNPEEHALLFLRISLFPASMLWLSATSLQLYRIQHFWTPQARYDLCAQTGTPTTRPEDHRPHDRDEVGSTDGFEEGTACRSQLLQSPFRVSAGGDTLGLRLLGGTM